MYWIIQNRYSISNFIIISTIVLIIYSFMVMHNMITKKMSIEKCKIKGKNVILTWVIFLTLKTIFVIIKYYVYHCNTIPVDKFSSITDIIANLIATIIVIRGFVVASKKMKHIENNLKGKII